MEVPPSLEAVSCLLRQPKLTKAVFPLSGKAATAPGCVHLSQATQRFSNENSNFTIDGVDVNSVTLVGMVFNKEERATDASFYLDDGTGRIEAKRWPVTDFDEVTFHYLECIFVHLFNLKVQGGTPQPNSASPAAKVGSMGSPTGLSNTSGHIQFTSPGPASVRGSNEDLQNMVHGIFEEPANLEIEQGVHLNDVVKRLPGFTKKQIMESVSFLSDEGFIYSTIDENHYKSTNG